MRKARCMQLGCFDMQGRKHKEPLPTSMACRAFEAEFHMGSNGEDIEVWVNDAACHVDHKLLPSK